MSASRWLLAAALPLLMAGCMVPALAADDPAGQMAGIGAFMNAYGDDLRNGNRAGIAARYDSRGAYFMGQGRKLFRDAEEIRQRYLGPWRAPRSFTWRELSFEAVGESAFLVLGQFDWGSAEAGVQTYSYTGLILREGNDFRIRVEDESRAQP